MISLPKHLSNILFKSALRSMPELVDKISVAPEKGRDWEYASPSCIQLFNKFKKQGSFGFPSCKDMAQSIIDNLSKEENDAISKIELS